MRLNRVYLAAAVFSSFDRQRNSEVGHHLVQRGYAVFLPQNVRTSSGARPPAESIFKECMERIDHSDLIVGLVDGADVDSGTAWELGYAFARGKPIVVLRTDYRSAEHGPVNIMIEFSSKVVLVNAPRIQASDAIAALAEAVDRVASTPPTQGGS